VSTFGLTPLALKPSSDCIRLRGALSGARPFLAAKGDAAAEELDFCIMLLGIAAGAATAAGDVRPAALDRRRMNEAGAAAAGFSSTLPGKAGDSLAAGAATPNDIESRRKMLGRATGVSTTSCGVTSAMEARTSSKFSSAAGATPGAPRPTPKLLDKRLIKLPFLIGVAANGVLTALTGRTYSGTAVKTSSKALMEPSAGAPAPYKEAPIPRD